MGKKILRFFSVIVFFPLTITFYLLKKLWKVIQKQKLKEYLSSINIESIDSLTGEEFEQFAYYLFLNLGFKVKKTSHSHDYGADLILEIKNIKITLQCKLYYNHLVGISAVQEVYSSLKHYDASLGIVLTNWFFSKPAINLSESTNVLLWDRNYLLRLLSLSESEKSALKQQLFCMVLNQN